MTKMEFLNYDTAAEARNALLRLSFRTKVRNLFCLSKRFLVAYAPRNDKYWLYGQGNGFRVEARKTAPFHPHPGTPLAEGD